MPSAPDAKELMLSVVDGLELALVKEEEEAAVVLVETEVDVEVSVLDKVALVVVAVAVAVDPPSRSSDETVLAFKKLILVILPISS